jgi:hypothetical protein
MSATDDHRTGFFVAGEILNASSAEARAAIVLRVPDAVLHQMSGPLMRACIETRFDLGARLLTVRLAALSAVRDEAGRLPDQATAPVEHYRRLVAGLAGVSP